MAFVKTEVQGAVEVITIDRPKALNALNPEVLADLKAAFEAVDQETVRCIVLTGEGDKSFVAGADIGSMSTMTKAEGEAFGKLGNDVFLMIESFPIPVIAAVNGFALGGGNELAMSCDIRICSDNAVFGQPEVGLGITPGFGGTQRLARLVGMGMAKQLVYSALNIKADEAYRIGLVNAVYPQAELMENVLKLAGKIAKNAPIAVRNCKKAINGGISLPIEKAVEVEEKLFGDCFETHDQQEGMACFLSREKPKPKAVFTNNYFEFVILSFCCPAPAGEGAGERKFNEIKERYPMKIGVIGAGTMGQGIAKAFAQVEGNTVALCDIKQEWAEKGLAKIKAGYDKLVAKGKIPQEKADAIVAAITPGLKEDLCADCDLVVEAAFEDMKVKQTTFGELDKICKPECVFASNTSSLSITEIGKGLSRPLVGMHFFNPADRMKLIEVIAGCNTPAETVEKIKEISVAIGKNPVQVNEAAGFVVNRILIPMINEAAFIKMEGVSDIAGIDTAMKLGANHPMGPLELGDFIGLDICLAIMDVLYHETGDSKYRACPLIRKMVRGGNLGCKTGKGFYVYNADRTKTPVDQL